MNNYLGICIPTFNRADYLNENLCSIVPQFAKHDLPIFISDNCSSDDTCNVVKQFQKVYSNISYHKNSYNMGLYRNILSAIKMAKTDYLWMMGDDDVIIKASVDRIIEKLKTNPDFIVLNSVGYDSTMRISHGNSFKCSRDRVFLPGFHEDLLTFLSGFYHGFMSAMIIKRSILSNLIEEFENSNFELFNNIWLPLMIFYKAIVNRAGLFLCEPALQMRLNHRPSEKNFFQYFYIDHLNALLFLKEAGYSLKSLRRAAKLGPVSAIVQAMRGMSDGNKLISYSDMIRHCPIIPIGDKYTFLIVDQTPTFLLRALTRIISKLNSDVKIHFEIV